MSRYVKIKDSKGIRKDTITNSYLATKYINGKEYSKTFKSLKKAINWRMNFHPSVPEPILEKKVEQRFNIVESMRTTSKLNGEDLGYTFKNVWDLYQKSHFPLLEKSSRERHLSKEAQIAPLMNFSMVEMTASLIDWLVGQIKERAIKDKSNRYNFDNELVFLKSFFNWYRENYDALFVNPVLKRHFAAGVIKKVVRKSKKLRPEELVSFFKELNPFWRDFAETQFYMGARVGEVAGLQAESVYLGDKEIRVQHTAVFSYQTKKFDYLKEYPKNGEISYASMNKRLCEIMTRRLPLSIKGFIFHNSGEPFSYRQIQYQYNSALKRAGLADKYSSTHIMRHSMGTITRRVTGSADMAQAVTRHKDIQVAQQYASVPTEANRKAVDEVFQFMSRMESDFDKEST